MGDPGDPHLPRLAFELAPHSITQLAYDYYSLYVDESIVASIVFIVDELNFNH